VRRLHLAVAQVHAQPGAIHANLAQITGFMRQAASLGVELLITPELSATGYGHFSEAHNWAEPAGDGPVYRELCLWAARTGVTISAGFIERRSNTHNIAQYVIAPDGGCIVQRKHCRPPYEAPMAGVPEERVYFTINGIRCAAIICADAGIDRLGEQLQHDGCELMTLVTAGGGTRQDVLSLDELTDANTHGRYLAMLREVFLPEQLISDCLRYGFAAAACNQVGLTNAGHYHRGHCTIVSQQGQVLALLPGTPIIEQMQPGMVHAMLTFHESNLRTA
jgi:predicted amidohydrolase